MPMRAPLRRLTLAAVAAVVALGASPARADDAPKITTAAIGEEMQQNYRGERTTAFVFVALGTASAGTGAVLVATQRDDFARGLGWSMITLGGLEALGAAFYAFQVEAELTHYTETIARDPAQFKREEGPHIHGTVSRFFYYRLSEALLALAGAGVATYGFASGRDLWKGVGIGVAGEGLAFLALDSIGQSRAVEYEDHVRRYEPTVAFQVGGGERPWSLGLGGRF